MTDAPKVSLRQQAEAVQFAAVRQASLANGASVRGLRPKSVEEYDHKRLLAAWKTLEWMAENEADIRAAVDRLKAEKAGT